MTVSREALALECQLRLIECAEKQDPQDKPIDLWIDAFWEGVRAGAKPRSVEMLTRLIALRRAQYLEAPHAQHRRPEPAAVQAIGREGDEASALAADVAAEIERARDRERRQRQAAHKHPGA